jgi:RNA-directed DNA polymerase
MQDAGQRKTHRHDRVREQRISLCGKLGGLYQYYGIRGNSEALKALYGEVVKMWKNWPGRSSQKSRLTWKDYQRLLERLPLPEPRIIHWSI